MKTLIRSLLLCLVFSPAALAQQPVIVDHTCTDIRAIPASAITQAKSSLHIAYGHTSHGSQLTDGMSGLVPFMNRFPNDAFADNLFAFNGTGANGALHLVDYYGNFGGYGLANDLGSGDWAQASRRYLNDHPGTNVIIWSWCGQADTTPAAIQQYLAAMTALELEFPAVKFVYMTGHLVGTGLNGNLHQRNEQIRAYCRTNNKILYDFADIESYDPDGIINFNALRANDNCDYDSDGNGSLDRNWATAWQAAHVENLDWYSCSAAHSKALNGNRKAYAAWHLWARLGGWSGPETQGSDVPLGGTAIWIIIGALFLVTGSLQLRKSTRWTA